MRPTPPEFRRGQHLKADDANAMREAGRSASPGAATGRMVKGYFGTASIADGASSAANTSILIYTGDDGIDGMTGITPGKSTTCLNLEWDGETIPIDGVTATVTVYNISTTAVQPNKYGKADLTKGRYVVDVESCGSPEE